MRRTVTAATALVGVGAIPCAADPAMPPGFVDAATIVPGLRTDIRYAGAHNFTGAPVTGYEAPRCWLTRPAAEALAAVQADLAPRGLGLLVYDCYRPLRAVARFVAWARTPGQEAGKREFYPALPKTRLFAEGYIAARSAHSRGSTIDLTLVDRDGRPLAMGTPFDLFGPASHPDAPGQPGDVAANRALLARAMLARGFAAYDKEWWHFTLKAEPYPTTPSMCRSKRNKPRLKTNGTGCFDCRQARALWCRSRLPRRNPLVSLTFPAERHS